MNRRQYRVLTADYKTPKTARYARGEVKTPTTWGRLPAAWQLAATILVSAACVAVGHAVVSASQAAILGP